MTYVALLGLLLMGLFAGLPEPSSPILDYLPMSSDSIYADIEQGRTEDGAFILGDADAPITIVTFQDFLCPHCQNYQPTLQEFIHEHVANGDARLEFRMLPAVDPVLSVLAFQLVECAEILGTSSFWDAHDAMYEITINSSFRRSSARDFAEALNLDYDELMDCTETAQQVYHDVELFFDNTAYVTGTPSVGWREGDGELRFDGLSRQPSAEELSVFVVGRRA